MSESLQQRIKRRKQYTTKQEWAYIAGIVDGEGCIGLSPRTKTQSRYYVYLRIASTNLKILKWLKRKCGVGSIQVANSEHKRPGFKKVYYYQTVTKKAVMILEKVLPHLIIKEKQAKVVITFQKRSKSLGYWNRDASKFKWQETAYKKIRKLNKKGVPIVK